MLPIDQDQSGAARRFRIVAMIPNALSATRLVLGLCFPLMPQRWWLGTVLVAGLSDLLDGAISRKFHAATSAGRMLDPIADKLFVLSVLATLIGQDAVSVWEVVLVGVRDLTVLAGSAYIGLRRGWNEVKRLRPRLLGKVTTAVQFLFIVLVLSYREAAAIAFVVAAGCSVLAGIDYARLVMSHGGADSGRNTLVDRSRESSGGAKR